MSEFFFDEAPVPAEVAEEPDDDRGEQDDGESFDDEVLGLIPNVDHQGAELRAMIGRKFHDEGRDLLPLGGLVHDDDRTDGDHDAQEVDQEGE